MSVNAHFRLFPAPGPEEKSGIAAGVRLGKERASKKPANPDEHRVGSRMVSRFYSQPLGVVRKSWMPSSITGNGSTFSVAAEQESHLWFPVSSLYREPSWSVPGAMLPLPEAELMAACQHSLLHLWTSGYGTAEHQELRYKFYYGLICTWR